MPLRTAIVATSIRSVGLLSTGESAEELPVALHEVKAAQPFRRFPSHLMKYQVPRFAIVGFHSKKNQFDGVFARIAVFVASDFCAGSSANFELFLELACQGLVGGLARFHLAARKLPLQRVRLLRLAAADQDPTAALEYSCHHL